MHFRQAIKDRNYGYLIWAIFAAITIFAIFVPVQPDMPTSGLDPSWKFALNYAKSAGLEFGRDLIFTFGPYASVYTGEYHPDTGKLMLLSSSFLAAFYLIALYQIGPRAGLFWLAMFLYVAAAFLYVRDILLISYPLLLSIVLFRNVGANKSKQSNSSDLLLVILVAPLGLLPLIKGSLLLITITFTPLYCLFLCASRRRAAAISAVLVPIITLLAAWILAGQRLGELHNYFRSMLDIISGYTDAMSVKGDAIQVVVFLSAAAAIVIFLAKTPNPPFTDRVFLIASVLAFLFVAFKGGFVRHDGHALMSANGLLIAVALLAIAGLGAPRFPLLFVGVAACVFFIDYRIIHSTNGILFSNAVRPYERLVSGINVRLGRSDDLFEEYNRHLDAIRSEVTISPMAGTSDIYAYNQAYLLASKNNWSPRPVLQSYSSYTPWLITRDHEHLLVSPPNNIVFRVETIDNRIPSLDDGLSWPTILNSYSPQKFADNYAYLKRSENVAAPVLNVIQNGHHAIGETVQLPTSNNPLFAKLTLKKTLAGKIASFFYKIPPTNMSFTLVGGDERTFRLIPSMAETGLIISPLIETTAEFSLLYGDRSNLEDKKVESIQLLVKGLGKLFWNSAYDLEISSIDMTRAEAQKQISPLAVIQPAQPEGFEKASDEACQTSIDTINGRSSSSIGPVANLLTLSGWMTTPENSEGTQQRVLVKATDENGNTAYFPTEPAQRPDVKKFFGRPNMPEPGFAASANLRSLSGNLTLGLARVRDGKLHDCNNTSVSIVRTDPPGEKLEKLKNYQIRAENSTSGCEGNIDDINGKSPSSVNEIAQKMLSIAGWTTLSGREGRTPEAVFITLTDSGGKKLFAKTHKMMRPDVAAHFGLKEPLAAGFTAMIPTSKLQQNIRVGVARLTDGILEECATITASVTVSP